MAVVLNPNLNNDQQKGQNSLNPGQMKLGSSAPAGGSSAPAVGASGGAQGTPAPSATPQGSGRFTNIQKYLNANKTGGQQIANNIQNKFGQQAGQVQSGLQNANTTLANKSGELNTQLGTQGQQQINQAFAKPEDYSGDSLQQFQNLAGGMKQNISNLADTEALRQQQLAQQNAALQQTAQLAGTEGGRFELLRKTMGSPAYSQGVQRLDQVLLGAAPNVTANLQQNLNSAVNANTQGINDLQKNRLESLSGLKGLSDERANQWQGLLMDGNAVNSLDNEINSRGLADIMASSEQRLAAANAQAADLPALRQRLASNTLTKQDLALLGLNQGAQLYDVNANNYMTQTDRVANIQNTAAKAEVDRYKALQNLAGMQNNANPFGDGSQAETYKAFDYDNAGLNQAMIDRKKEYEVNRLNPILDKLYSSVGGARRAQMAGGMGRAAVSDAARHYQAVLPGLLKTLNPDNTTFENVYNIANQAFAGSGGVAGAAQARFENAGHLLQNYQPVLNQMRSNLLGANAQDAAPAAAAAPTDWAAIKAAMASKGYV